MENNIHPIIKETMIEESKKNEEYSIREGMGIHHHLHRFREGGTRITKEIRERVVGYIAAAFGLVAGLAWNEFIKQLIETLFPIKKDTLWAKGVYALVMTILLVIITLIITKFLSNEEKKQQ